MKSIIIIFVISLVTLKLSAQDYNNAVRVSTGEYWGVSYKRLFNQKNGAMGRFQVNNKGAQLTGLRLFHTPAFPATSSQWFFAYGYGVHFAYRTKIDSRNLFTPFAPPIVNTGHFFSPGVDGYLSLEYRFLKVPFVLSADYMPNFEFFGPNFFRLNMNNFTVSAAFTF
ncbi:hypothetical protein [Carboxylicivirga sp. N1Y90]|uniref:hypothetical protein n=1 Tax=Carboxylicivirga fragile TaxID=3417571 RepID=UPI003D327552|nr:hypothetical protein [Marinilabiliaceae bacterium N1Y90]